MNSPLFEINSTLKRYSWKAQNVTDCSSTDTLLIQKKKKIYIYIYVSFIQKSLQTKVGDWQESGVTARKV